MNLSNIPTQIIGTTCMNDIRQISQGEPEDKIEAVFEVLNDYYSVLMTEGQVILLIINEAMEIDFISKTVCQELKYQTESLIGKDIFSILSSEVHEQFSRGLEIASQKVKTCQRLEDLSIYCNEKYLHYYDGLLINLTQDPRIKGYLLYLHDVSQKHLTEQKLRDLNLELDSFVYKASHDLRAPLTSLSGLINIMEDEFPESASENFEMMKKSVKKLDVFIKQLAEYSRNTHTQGNYTKIDFQYLIQDVIDTYRHLKNFDKIHFSITVDKEKSIFFDEFRLRVILSNLISNAIKYHQINQKKPFIHIEVRFEESQFVITVRDNGIGISQEYQETIFDMFIRATDYSEGSGLGLYIVKKALEKLKGKITVRSSRNDGTRFEVILPYLG